MPLVQPHVTYPGVYVQEVENPVHTIVPVATSTTAFIGRALRGPVNEPILIHSFGEFQNIFGGLWLDNPLGYAVQDFFLNGGSDAVIVRVHNAGSPDALKIQTVIDMADTLAQTRAATPDSVYLAVKKKADEIAKKRQLSTEDRMALRLVVMRTFQKTQAPDLDPDPAKAAAQVADATGQALDDLRSAVQDAEDMAKGVQAAAARALAAKPAPDPAYIAVVVRSTVAATTMTGAPQAQALLNGTADNIDAEISNGLDGDGAVQMVLDVAEIFIDMPGRIAKATKADDATATLKAAQKSIAQDNPGLADALGEMVTAATTPRALNDIKKAVGDYAKPFQAVADAVTAAQNAAPGSAQAVAMAMTAAVSAAAQSATAPSPATVALLRAMAAKAAGAAAAQNATTNQVVQAVQGMVQALLDLPGKADGAADAATASTNIGSAADAVSDTTLKEVASEVKKAAADAAAVTTPAATLADVKAAAQARTKPLQDVIDAGKSAQTPRAVATKAADAASIAAAIADAANAAAQDAMLPTTKSALANIANQAQLAARKAGANAKTVLVAMNAAIDSLQNAPDAAAELQTAADTAKVVVAANGKYVKSKIGDFTNSQDFNKDLKPATRRKVADLVKALNTLSDSLTMDSTPTSLQTGIDNITKDYRPLTRARVNITDDNDQTLITLEARDPGAWGNGLKARVSKLDDKVAEQRATDFGVQPGDLFNLAVYDSLGGTTETFPFVTLNDGPRRLDKVLAQESKLVSLMAGNLPLQPPGPRFDDANPLDLLPMNVWDPGNALSSYWSVLPEEQTDDGGALQPEDFLGDEFKKTGIYALENADIFNLMIIPSNAGPQDRFYQELVPAALQYCKRRRAILMIDPPNTWTDKDAAKAGWPIPGVPPDPNLVIYFPRICKANPRHDGQIEQFSALGTIAGVVARTDNARGVWKAPAGLQATLNGVTELEIPLTDAENGELNPLGINCLRTFRGTGTVVWGARTAAGDDRLANQWKYLPVRRTALFIEESLFRGTQWAVFEPNDEPLWSSLRLNIGTFMHDLWRQGAFQGQKPSDAYFVKCDAEVNPQSDIDRGIVNVVIGFAPLKPAEFVILYIQQINPGQPA